VSETGGGFLTPLLVLNVFGLHDALKSTQSTKPFRPSKDIKDLNPMLDEKK